MGRCAALCLARGAFADALRFAKAASTLFPTGCHFGFPRTSWVPMRPAMLLYREERNESRTSSRAPRSLRRARLSIMNKKGSASAFIQQALIGLLIWVVIQHFLGGNHTSVPPRKAPALAQAFAGIDPAVAGTPALDAKAANAEVTKLQAQITANDSDDLAQWSRLRVGLIQQYVLKNLQSSTRGAGFLGFGGTQTYYSTYDDIIRNRAGDAIEAQALYQEGDLLWRQSLAKPDIAPSAITVFDSFIEQGRGSVFSPGKAAAFKALQIYVPTIVDPAKVPLSGFPSGGFRLVKVSDLQGTLQAPNPQGIVDRANTYYATTGLYKLFDGFVRLLGSNPIYSYGLAYLLFAVILRSLLQPLYIKQYDSMKGMAAIAPEMKKIQERFKDKKEPSAQQAQMKEIQELQRRHGVNPMLGCGLAVIQMPIFFMFVSPMIRHYEPKMDLAGASFFWIHSLARPDIALLVIYAISQFLSMRLSSTTPTDDQQRQMQKVMTFSPFFFSFFVASFPSAFVLYWTVYNVLGTFYQWKLLKAADPSKTMMKALVGDGFGFGSATASSPEVAIAPRPTGLNGNGNGSSSAKSVKIQSKTPTSLNGTLADAKTNGKNGGKVVRESALEGTVLGPTADEVERRKKKKK